MAVLHLEEKCDRAIEWALKIEPSMKYLVSEIHHYYVQGCSFLISSIISVPSFLVQVVSGGVASNQYVRSRLNKLVEKKGLQLVCPPPSLCTDNGKATLLACPH